MLKLPAQLLSFIFHPLLLLTYILMFLMYVNPYLFGNLENCYIVLGERVCLNNLLVLQVFMQSFLLPAFAVFMMRMLGLVESFTMANRQERIGPYIVTGIFYLWIFINLKNISYIPVAYKIFVLGATIALFLAFTINLFSKISMHAVGAGGAIGMIFITMLFFSYDNLITFLLLSILLAGLIGTSRLILKAHHPADIYGGYMVGFFTQFLALRFLAF